jgi:Protein of unknown function (DUF3738)
MFRVGVCSAIFLGASAAQAPTPTHTSDSPRFDVVAIHPSDPRGFAGPSGCQTTIGLMRCINVTLKRCIMGAYRIGADRVVGGPNWIDTDRFQITGKTDQPLGDKGLIASLRYMSWRVGTSTHGRTDAGNLDNCYVVRSPAALREDSIFSPPLLPRRLTKPRTVCACQPVASLIWASVAPLARFIIAITSAFLLRRASWSPCFLAAAAFFAALAFFAGLAPWTGFLGFAAGSLGCESGASATQ